MSVQVSAKDVLQHHDAHPNRGLSHSMRRISLLDINKCDSYEIEYHVFSQKLAP